jgi:hypothetical protein
MFTEMIKWGHVRRAVDALLPQVKPKKLSRKSPLGHFAATALRNKIMFNYFINGEQERGVDTSYRARRKSPHHTYCIMLVLSRFCVSLCARSWRLTRNNLAILGIPERAIGALRRVSS